MAQLGANERAWLNAIRHAEGTSGANGYATTFGYQSFDPAKGHPRRVVKSGGYASDAAGAYQFLSTTWDGVNRQMGTNAADFSPAAQDRAALQLIRNRGVDPSQAISREAVAKLAPEWASLPTMAGKSYYGQPVKGYDAVAAAFQGGGGGGGGVSNDLAAGDAAIASGGAPPTLPLQPTELQLDIPAAATVETGPAFDLAHAPGVEAISRQMQQSGEQLAQSSQQLQGSAEPSRRMAGSSRLIQQVLAMLEDA
jgi:muramidase (phage lysozyme)